MGPLCGLRPIRSSRQPEAGGKDGFHGFQQASGRGSSRSSTGPYRGCHQKSALCTGVPSSVTSEPLFGAERRPQSRGSIVLRFKSARSNRTASKRAEPANHAKGEPESAPPALRRGRPPRRWRPATARKSARGIGIERKETAPATRAAPLALRPPGTKQRHRRK